MAIVHDIDVNYNSTIDDLNLLYDLSYDDTLLNKPLAVLMHGFNGDKDGVTAAWKERLINNYSVVCIAVDMRGRTASEGEEDASARELYDIYDAINDAINVYNTRIDATNINVLGYSGGGGNILKMVCSFPDLFGVACPFFGISDYGYDGVDGWWHTTAAQRLAIEGMVDGTPAAVPDNYYARAAVFFTINTQYARKRVYHDLQDVLVPPVNSQNVQTEITALSYTNWVFDFTNLGDDPRWIHGLPILATDGEPNIQAEPAIFAEINSGVYKDPVLLSSGTLWIPGYLKTKKFGVWLNEGLSDAGTVDYNLDINTFTIRNNRVTLNDVLPITFEYYGLKGGAIYRISVDDVDTYEKTDADGTLTYKTHLDANESVKIIIKRVVTDMLVMKTVDFGERPGMIGGDHKDTYLDATTVDAANGTAAIGYLMSVGGFITVILGRWSILGHIPSDAIILSATAHYSKADAAGPPQAMSMGVHELVTDWGVTPTDAGITQNPPAGANDAATWFNAFSVSSTDWAAGPAPEHFDVGDYGAQEVAEAFEYSDPINTEHTIDFTSMARRWLMDDGANLGYVLRRVDAGANFIQLHLEDSATVNSRPYLRVVYALPVEKIQSKSQTTVGIGIM